MDQNLITFTDLSNINLNYYNINGLLDINYKNIININSLLFKSEQSRFLKIEFSRPIVIKNIQLLTGNQELVKYKLYYNIPYTSIYKPYTSTYQFSADILDSLPVSTIIAELETPRSIPNAMRYVPTYTDDFFIVDEFNETNIKWSYDYQISNIRYSFSIPNGKYSISQFNNELLKIKFDTRGPVNLFKNDYPLEIDGNFPNFKLNLINNSSNNIIIYSDSNLFTFLGINQTIQLSPNSSMTINFTYEPFKNLPFNMSFNNTSIYDDFFNALNSNNFVDSRPITQQQNENIIYSAIFITRELISQTSIINAYDKLRVGEINKPDGLPGLFLIVDDLSNNIIINETSNIININTYDSSLSYIESSGVILSKNIDTQNINIDNINVTDPIYISNTTVNDIKCHNLFTNSIDISYGYIDVKNKTFNINNYKYKYLRFDLNYNIFKNTTFNNLTFYDINNNHPLFRVWKYNKSTYNLVSDYDISFSGTIDTSSVVFEFFEQFERGLRFHYK